MKSLYFDVNLPRMAMTKALAPFFPGVYYSGLSALCLGEIDKPKLFADDWVVVKSRLCGICGSDLHLITLKIDPRVSLAALPRHLSKKKEPKWLGHEVVGEVVEKGDAVDNLALGDRVALFSAPSCRTMGIDPPCKFCREGHHAICQNKSEAQYPENMGAGFSEYFTVQKDQLFKVPEALNDEEAALLEPLASSIHTVLKRRPLPGEKILVVGTGIIGLNVIQAARAFCPDCSITALVKYPHQAKMAKERGADQAVFAGDNDPYERIAEVTGGKVYKGKFGNQVLMGGFQVIYDCVGTARTLQNSLRWAASRGTLVLVGVELKMGKFDYTPLWHQELTIIGSDAHGTEEIDGERISTFALAARLIQEKKVNLQGLITHTFPLEEYKEAMATLLNKKASGAIKGAFRFDP